MRFSLRGTMALFGVGLIAHCMQVSEGIEVDIAYQPTATPAAVRTDLGYRVRLERALIAIGSVELIRCDNFVLDAWALFAPARARAHQLATPTSLGVPLVIDLMQSAGAPQFAGTLRPPPGRYCGIRVLAMPADEDAEGLTEENNDLREHSVLVEGQVENAAAGEPAAAFILRLKEVLDCDMPFDHPMVFDRPVLATITIQIDQTGWFDGIDLAEFALTDSSAAQQRIRDNVRSSLQAVLSQPDDGP